MLPENWIERIFAEMSVLYGSKFADLWAGTDPAQIREGWAKKLAGFKDHPKAIRAALDSLDERPFPPTLPEFVAICRAQAVRIGAELPKLEHKPTAEELARAEAAAKKAAEAVKAFGSRDFLDWAKRPRSKIAFNEILKLAGKDQRFAEILDKLIADGITDGVTLLKCWNGDDWVAA